MCFTVFSHLACLRTSATIYLLLYYKDNIFVDRKDREVDGRFGNHIVHLPYRYCFNRQLSMLLV